MGIFEDEARKMKEEAEAKVRGGEAQQAERSEIAESIRQDLLSFLAISRRTDIEVVTRLNRINARLRASSKEIEIICEGDDSFAMSDDQGAAQQLDKIAMLRRVIRWVESVR